MKTVLTNTQIFGLILLPVSMVIYHYVPQSNGNLEGASLLIFAIAIIYFFLSFADRPKKTNFFMFVRPRLNWHILLSLLLVSCFTLNKDMHVFALTPLWVKVLLVATLTSFILIAMENLIPEWLKKTSSFVFGIGILLFIYYTVVLVPLIPIAIIGVILLGISIHLLVPLMLLIVSIVSVFNRKCKNAKLPFILSGFVTGFICVLIYTGLFMNHSNAIKNVQRDLVLNDDNNLPEWVSYAQKCTSEFWTKRVIGRGLLYEEISGDWWGFGFDRGSYSEIREHDPLVAAAALFCEPLPLTNEEQVNILSASAGTRHYAYEKLWSGRNLHVSKELMDVRIYPDFRMAYFEKTFWITNTHHWERSQQEALFTFYLPEGAVASSLSLWIDGKEEKSRLTTRKKATNAYKTIVGRERRDPVVLHWQEGNRLSATIFPCTPQEPRRVKIGLTVPLMQSDDRLSFSNMKVLGPDNSKADEIIHVKVIGELEDIEMPHYFDEEKPGQFIYSGMPVDEWACSFPVKQLSDSQFTFNNKAWQLRPLKYKGGLKPEAIYLDINNSWHKNEVKEILQQAGNTPVYFYDGKMILLSKSNMNDVLGAQMKRSFSIFPVFHIANPSTALLITKGYQNSPIPSELKGSEFHNQLLNYMSGYNKPIATLVIDRQKSPYITALEQYKIVECNSFSLEQVKSLNIESWYNNPLYHKEGVNIPVSGMSIVQVDVNNDKEQQSVSAPSHLLRLYNYHTLMQEAGHLFLQQDAEIPETVYSLCNEAFIVSPVSSLIVLETQKDYERFGINENENSLRNANLNDSGAVPEPGEWALIIILGIVICTVYIKYR
ncbi:XrtN system VIT domain-containing protein [Carboxylicivirga sp. RSCT41]|uniref:XrtN system VIT domain-containing protein n=1 Tax=Carboxylicivirga agarovorans TaxID=3417570 RepID=UPI003D334564